MTKKKPKIDFVARDLVRDVAIVVAADDWWHAREGAAKLWSRETGEAIDPWDARILVVRR